VTVELPVSVLGEGGVEVDVERFQAETQSETPGSEGANE